MEAEAEIKQIVDKIVAEFKPEKVILFGSHAWGKPNKDSDVDLFIVKDSNDNRQTARAISRLIFPRPFPMDIFVYTTEQLQNRIKCNDFFIKDIITRGKVLHDSH